MTIEQRINLLLRSTEKGNVALACNLMSTLDTEKVRELFSNACNGRVDSVNVFRHVSLVDGRIYLQGGTSHDMWIKIECNDWMIIMVDMSRAYLVDKAKYESNHRYESSLIFLPNRWKEVIKL